MRRENTVLMKSLSLGVAVCVLATPCTAGSVTSTDTLHHALAPKSKIASLFPSIPFEKHFQRTKKYLETRFGVQAFQILAGFRTRKDAAWFRMIWIHDLAQQIATLEDPEALLFPPTVSKKLLRKTAWLRELEISGAMRNPLIDHLTSADIDALGLSGYPEIRDGSDLRRAIVFQHAECQRRCETLLGIRHVRVRTGPGWAEVLDSGEGMDWWSIMTKFLVPKLTGQGERGQIPKEESIAPPTGGAIDADLIRLVASITAGAPASRWKKAFEGGGKKELRELLEDYPGNPDFIASNIQNYSEGQFAEMNRPLVELMLNGIDALLKGKAIGRFGVGFYAMMHFLREEPDARVVVQTSTGREAWRLEFYSQDGRIRVRMAANPEGSDAEARGTSVQWITKSTAFDPEETEKTIRDTLSYNSNIPLLIGGEVFNEDIRNPAKFERLSDTKADVTLFRSREFARHGKAKVVVTVNGVRILTKDISGWNLPAVTVVDFPADTKLPPSRDMLEVNAQDVASAKAALGLAVRSRKPIALLNALGPLMIMLQGRNKSYQRADDLLEEARRVFDIYAGDKRNVLPNEPVYFNSRGEPLLSWRRVAYVDRLYLKARDVHWLGREDLVKATPLRLLEGFLSKDYQLYRAPFANEHYALIVDPVSKIAFVNQGRLAHAQDPLMPALISACLSAHNIPHTVVTDSQDWREQINHILALARGQSALPGVFKRKAQAIKWGSEKAEILSLPYVARLLKDHPTWQAPLMRLLFTGRDKMEWRLFLPSLAWLGTDAPHWMEEILYNKKQRRLILEALKTLRDSPVESSRSDRLFFQGAKAMTVRDVLEVIDGKSPDLMARIFTLRGALDAHYPGQWDSKKFFPIVVEMIANGRKPEDPDAIDPSKAYLDDFLNAVLSKDLNRLTRDVALRPYWFYLTTDMKGFVKIGNFSGEIPFPDTGLQGEFRLSDRMLRYLKDSKNDLKAQALQSGKEIQAFLKECSQKALRAAPVSKAAVRAELLHATEPNGALSYAFIRDVIGNIRNAGGKTLRLELSLSRPEHAQAKPELVIGFQDGVGMDLKTALTEFLIPFAPNQYGRSSGNVVAEMLRFGSRLRVKTSDGKGHTLYMDIQRISGKADFMIRYRIADQKFRGTRMQLFMESDVPEREALTIVANAHYYAAAVPREEMKIIRRRAGKDKILNDIKRAHSIGIAETSFGMVRVSRSKKIQGALTQNGIMLEPHLSEEILGGIPPSLRHLLQQTGYVVDIPAGIPTLASGKGLAQKEKYLPEIQAAAAKILLPELLKTLGRKKRGGGYVPSHEFLVHAVFPYDYFYDKDIPVTPDYINQDIGRLEQPGPPAVGLSRAQVYGPGSKDLYLLLAAIPFKEANGVKLSLNDILSRLSTYRKDTGALGAFLEGERKRKENNDKAFARKYAGKREVEDVKIFPRSVRDRQQNTMDVYWAFDELMQGLAELGLGRVDGRHVSTKFFSKNNWQAAWAYQGGNDIAWNLAHMEEFFSLFAAYLSSGWSQKEALAGSIPAEKMMESLAFHIDTNAHETAHLMEGTAEGTHGPDFHEKIRHVLHGWLRHPKEVTEIFTRVREKYRGTYRPPAELLAYLHSKQRPKRPEAGYGIQSSRPHGLLSPVAAPAMEYAALAPSSIFHGDFLDKQQLALLQAIGSLLFEHKNLSNAQLRALAQEQFAAWYHDPEQSLFIYFDHVQRQNDGTLLLPFGAGLRQGIATLSPGAEGSVAMDIRPLATIALSGGQELHTSNGSWLARLFRYANRIAFKSLKSFGPTVKKLDTGEILRWDRAFTPFWRDKSTEWMRDFAAAARAAGVPIKTMGVFRSVHPRTDERSFRLEIAWQPEYAGNRPRAMIVFHVDEVMAGGIILDTFLAVARAHALLPPMGSSLKVVWQDGKNMPAYDRRKGNTLYMDRDDLARPFDALRTLHLYSDMFRVRLRALRPELTTGEALFQGLLFSLRYIGQLNTHDRERVIRRLAGNRSGSDWDHLLSKILHAGVLADGKELSARGVATFLEEFMKRRDRHAILRKRLAKESQDFSDRLKNREGAGAFLEALARTDVEQQPWQRALVLEAGNHAKQNYAKERRLKNILREKRKAQRQLYSPETREALTTLFRGIVDLKDRAWIKQQAAERKLPAPAAIEAQASGQENAGRKEFLRGVLGTAALMAFIAYPLFSLAVPAASALFNAALSALAPDGYATWAIAPSAMQQMISYATLAVGADYFAQVLARKFEGKPLSALFTAVSFPVELFNAAFTAFAYRFINTVFPLPSAGTGVSWALWAGATALLIAWRGILIYLVSYYRGKTFSRAITYAQQWHLFYLEAREQAIAHAQFARDPMALNHRLKEIRADFNRRKERLDKQAARIRLKSDVAWAAIRWPSILVKLSNVNLVPEKYQTLIDGLMQSQFTTVERYAGFQKRYFVPKEDALVSGKDERRSTWYLMNYYIAAAWNKLRSPKLRDLRRLVDGLYIPAHPITHLLVDVYDRDPELRLHAVREFGEANYGPVLPILEWSARHDPDMRVRQEAVVAIARIAGGLASNPDLPSRTQALLEQAA